LLIGETIVINSTPINIEFYIDFIGFYPRSFSAFHRLMNLFRPAATSASNLMVQKKPFSHQRKWLFRLKSHCWDIFYSSPMSVAK
jgi:hypothetical protein